MADPPARLRVVESGETSPRSRRPGPAVLAILLFGAVFVAALWILRARSPLFERSQPAIRAVPAVTSLAVASAAGPGRRPPSRDALLSGEAVPESGRADYFHHLAADRCDCGCGRTISDCLVNEKACSRSPVLADGLRSRDR